MEREDQKAVNGVMAIGALAKWGIGKLPAGLCGSPHVAVEQLATRVTRASARAAVVRVSGVARFTCEPISYPERFAIDMVLVREDGRWKACYLSRWEGSEPRVSQP